ncbi:MAG: phenylalanine--tRNA ligase subunit beta [Opitutales bacterium]|nr:phenylalanine--tRNA ligase subunit beta [Opitutales bacterium]
MKISLEWLSKYVDLSPYSADDIEKALTMIGFEVEGIHQTGLPPMENLVVGKVLEKEPHPDADRLNVCQVDVGQDVPVQIVCGATNYKVGDSVPVALPKCVLPGDFKIKKSKLRGVKSEGMMCSARELGMGEDHSGLLILDNPPATGTSINDVFPAGDTVFDIEVTPNRPDCLSHLGMARELAAYFCLDLVYPEVNTSVVRPDAAPRHLVGKISIETEENCPHYQGWSIRGVKIAPSPKWLQKQLTAVGLRPINNVVDITNYVLMELGQPLHAFDAAKISGSQIIVRMAQQGEKITTLDEKERTLEDYMMVIADAQRPLVIAGVMGSVTAEVDDSTVDIFLESAYFKPSCIRRTSRRLALSSDSSYRYERGVDPSGAEFAAMRAVDLILQCAGGELAGPPLVAGESLELKQEIEITANYVRKSIGFDAPDAEIARVFESLELELDEFTSNEGEHTFCVGIPSFRLDLQRRADLVEEFLRIYGTDKIPSTPVTITSTIHEDSPLATFQQKAATLLVGQGFNECVHYPMRSEVDVAQWVAPEELDQLALANPLASDQSHLRASVLPGLLDAVKLNRSRHNDPRRLFEIGRAFRSHEGKLWEVLYIGFVLVPQSEQSWKKREEDDFYTAAALAQKILSVAGINVTSKDFALISDHAAWQQGQAAQVGGFTQGWSAEFGMLDVTMLSDKGIDDCVFAGGLYFLPAFLDQGADRSAFKAFSLYPPATRDLALVVDQSVPAGVVQAKLESLSAKSTQGAFAVESVSIFDIYQGKGVEDGKKSLAFSIRFRSVERTLNDEEVNKAFEFIQAKIQEEADYRIRS